MRVCVLGGVAWRLIVKNNAHTDTHVHTHTHKAIYVSKCSSDRAYKFSIPHHHMYIPTRITEERELSCNVNRASSNCIAV